MTEPTPPIPAHQSAYLNCRTATHDLARAMEAHEAWDAKDRLMWAKNALAQIQSAVAKWSKPDE